ncbi:L,D-transpeptidase [Rhodococcus ruber]|uniref:L,D-transpeptidase n=1 Tax=Rhodococcus ruber TaxID=1830 RepID=UPI003453B993
MDPGRAAPHPAAAATLARPPLTGTPHGARPDRTPSAVGRPQRHRPDPADLQRLLIGVHVVTEKHEDFLMAVRISDNGEFIHANPATLGQRGATNVTNGCINLSLGDAQAYFATAMYGDPVEVSGTSIELSAADGDLYDWAIDWPTWQSMSAL